MKPIIVVLSICILARSGIAVHIIWDNTVDFEEIYDDPLDLISRMDEIRIPNQALIYPGIVYSQRSLNQPQNVSGTLWCGAGNISTGLNDFGKFRDTDKCCRNHDLCPNVIQAYQTKYNLTNPTFFTRFCSFYIAPFTSRFFRLICKCDEEFRECLKTVNKFPAKSVGFLYFTVLGQKCFKKDYPIAGCEKFSYFP